MRIRLNQSLVGITIVSKDKELSEELKYVINIESKYFKEKVKIATDLKELGKIEDTNILIIFINEESEEKIKQKITVLQNKIAQIIVIDTQQRRESLKNMERYENIKVFSEIKDKKVFIFQLLYNYYDENLKNTNSEHELEDRKKSEEILKKFEEYENKQFLSDKIDEIVLEGTNCKFEGYKALKNMIILCIINKVKIDKTQNYEYLYKAMTIICKDQKWFKIKDKIISAMTRIRKRSNKLKIQKVLEKIKRKLTVERVIIISMIVEHEIKKVELPIQEKEITL